jgi:hypothetical protein
MTLTNAGSNIANGVYIGPYTAQIDGNTFKVICDDYNSETYLNESWTATALTFDQVLTGGKFANQADSTARYSKVGWLATELMDHAADPGVTADIQFALWSVFGNSVPLSSGAQGWLNEAQAHGTDPKSSFANLMFYKPLNQACTSGPCPSWPPQEFVTIGTPEPATLSLVGLGFAAIVAARRRRRKLEA